jgi:hypothetical protein
MVPLENFISSEEAKEKISTRGNESIYVSYLDAGYGQKVDGGTVYLPNLKAPYKAIWLDPSTGKNLLVINNTQDNNQKIQRPAYIEDIVLVLKRL